MNYLKLSWLVVSLTLCRLYLYYNLSPPSTLATFPSLGNSSLSPLQCSKSNLLIQKFRKFMFITIQLSGKQVKKKTIEQLINQITNPTKDNILHFYKFHHQPNTRLINIFKRLKLSYINMKPGVFEKPWPKPPTLLS